MEIILKQDVERLGHKDEIVVVKNGYATNFLIPQGYAIMATATAKKIHAENLRQRAHKEAKVRDEASAMAAKLEGILVKLVTKVSSQGKIFGSINNIQIAEALVGMGFEIDRRSISIVDADNLKEVGTYEAIVRCYKDIKATVKLEVVGEEE